MDVKDIKIDIEKTFGEWMLVGNPKEKFVFEEGKKTDKLEAISYPVISTKIWNRFTVNVKEQTPSLEYKGNPMPVTFINAEAKLWQDFRTNEIKVSISADSISAVPHNKLKVNKGVEE